MLKRFVISSLVLLAFALLQAHNFSIHHHEAEIFSSHHDDHEKDSDKSPFSDQNHNFDYGKNFVKTQNHQTSIEKPVIDHSLFNEYCNRLISFNDQPPTIPPDWAADIFSILLVHNIPLRAPPCPHIA